MQHRSLLVFWAAVMGILNSIVVAAATPAPEFSRYPAVPERIPRPKEPDVRRGSAHQYRTMIRIGAVQGPDFAGHYTLVTWGCGVACQGLAIVDARNGKVHFPKALALNAYQAVTDKTPPFDYRIDSTLLIVAGSPDDRKPAGLYYYRWTGSELQLLRYERREWPR